ncbi:hypothetical protein ERO13_A12G148250v2 [Gossypium hirsutum]|uniref:Uncharacterized protein n=1 Tax=Gossypium darwinii TaxID=34276 RepID=A0A5D2EAN2_GOSDA|nr:hypothetical protein ERO13_A12G148250v2 [Gossypium hirsutum]TYG90319.1 hypothetical protein ES288_A12G171900v1 [Gossypium darwinii]
MFGHRLSHKRPNPAPSNRESKVPFESLRILAPNFDYDEVREDSRELKWRYGMRWRLAWGVRRRGRGRWRVWRRCPVLGCGAMS